VFFLDTQNRPVYYYLCDQFRAGPVRRCGSGPGRRRELGPMGNQRRGGDFIAAEAPRERCIFLSPHSRHCGRSAAISPALCL